MRKIVFFVLAVAVLCCNVFAAFVPEPAMVTDPETVTAPETVVDPEAIIQPEPVVEPETIVESEPVVEPETVLDFESTLDLESGYEPLPDLVPDSSYDDGLGELVGIEVRSLNPVTPSDTSGLKSVLLDLIGDYDAVVVEYEYQNNQNYSSYLREVQPDYVWLCSAGLLGLVVYCVFRLGGALLRD